MPNHWQTIEDALYFLSLNPDLLDDGMTSAAERTAELDAALAFVRELRQGLDKQHWKLMLPGGEITEVVRKSYADDLEVRLAEARIDAQMWHDRAMSGWQEGSDTP